MKKYKLFFAALISALCISTGVKAHAAKPLEGSSVSVIYSLNNKIHGINYNAYMHPASTQKLLTALASLLYLGPDYTFKTALYISKQSYANGKLKISANGTLAGDIKIKFTGDPFFTSENLSSLFKSLKDQGVKHIKGKVLLDISRFTGKDRADGWSASDLPVCFTAPSSALIINHNCAGCRLKPSSVGNRAKVEILNRNPINVSSEAITVKAGDFRDKCTLEADILGSNSYHLSGCIPKLKKDTPYPLLFAVNDPKSWGIDWTAKILKNLNLSVSGGISVTKQNKSGFTPYAVINSPRLYNLVKVMLQKSDNLYADSIAKTVGFEYFKRAGSYQDAVTAIRSILKEKAGINLKNAYMVDGSGLSSHNLLSAKNLFDVLTYIKDHDSTLNLIAILPKSGISGTLKYRPSVKGSQLKGAVIAKTGSLQNVSNLAGFIKSKNNKLIPFVILENSLTYPQDLREEINQLKKKSPHYEFEKSVITDIYNEKILSFK